MAAHRTRYSAVAILLHWLIAALILTNIWFGWRMGQLKGLAQFELFQLHKSIGISVLVLSLVRLGWRLVSPPPSYPASMTRIERLVASAMHWLLYGFMIVLPFTGWVIVSASLYNLPTLLFKTVPWPHIGFIHDLPMATRKLVEDRVGDVHEWLAWTLLALAVFHVAAAIKHHLWDRDDVLGRMLPLMRRRRPAAFSEN
jgi:cytochrome b561